MSAQDRPRILVVDDHSTALKDVSQLLTNAGCDTFEAGTGAEALRLAKEIKPDLILLDDDLPDIQGISVCQVIKVDEDLAGIYVVLLSGMKTESDIQAEGLDAGADGYITRPIPNRELLARINAMLRLKSLEKRSAQALHFTQTVLATSPIGIATFRYDGSMITANEALLALIGHDADDIPKLNLKEIECWKESGLLEEARPVLEAGTDLCREIIVERPRGERVWLDCRLTAFDSGDESGLLLIANDITGRKKAEEQLKASEALLKATGRMAKVGGWEFDPETSDVHWTEQTYHIHEVPLDYHPPLAEALSFFHPEDRPNLERAFQRAIDHGEPYDMELRFQTAKGRSLWTRTICKPVVENGKTVKLIGTFQDITDRKKAQEALQESEQRFRAVFDNAAVGIDVLDSVGRFVEVNSALANMLGYTREELRERTLAELTHPDDLADSKEKFDLLVKGKIDSYRLEKRYIRKDGNVVWGDVAASALSNPYGEHQATIGVISDISQRKRVEDLVRLRLELQEFVASHSLEELLQKTLDEVGTLTDSPIGFYHFVESDEETLSLQARSSRTIKEFCTAEGKGMHYPVSQAGVWVDCVHQRRPVIHNDYLSLPGRKGLPEGHAPVIRELVVPIMRSGRIVAILGIGNRPSNYTEEDVDTVAYLADVAWGIVERKRAEEQVKESLKEKEILLREIHHRVKNNLSLVCSLLSLQAGYADETHARLFQDLEARVMSMALAHERLYQSDSLANLNLEDYIGGLIDHLVGSIRLRAPVQLRKEIHDVSFGLDTAIPVGFIVTELVSNCLKHAFPDDREGEITISLRSLPNNQFELEVSDNGVGIPEEMDLADGTSLGMDLVDAFVTKLKGSMEISRDNGTQVRLKFKEIQRAVPQIECSWGVSGKPAIL